MYKYINLAGINPEILSRRDIEVCMTELGNVYDSSFCSIGIFFMVDTKGCPWGRLSGRENTLSRVSDILSSIILLDDRKIGLSSVAEEKKVRMEDVRNSLKALGIALSGSMDPLSYLQKSDTFLLKVQCEKQLFMRIEHFIEKIKIEDQVNTQTNTIAQEV